MRFLFTAFIIIFFASHTKAQVVDPIWDRINLTGLEAKVLEVEPEKVKKGFPLWIPLAGGALGGGILLLTSGDSESPPELPPINALDDRLDIPCDGSGSINVLNNDTGEGLQLQSFSNTTGLDFQHNGTGLITISAPGAGTFTLSYSISDRHGQIATAVITIVGTDDINPQVDCPDDVIIDCGTPTEPALTGLPAITDNCDPDPMIRFMDEETVGACPFVKSIIRTFVVTDDSGNSANCSHTILIKDEDAPSFQQEAQPLLLDCGVADNELLIMEWLENNGGARAEDACGSELTWSHNLVEVPSAVGSVEVTFTVSDSCGNQATTTTQIAIEDTSPPLLLKEATDLLIECGDDIDATILDWLDNNGGAQAEDACGSLSWSNDFAGSIAACDPSNPTQITFTVADEAGNSVSTTAGVSISDTEPPEYVCPPDISLDFGQAPIPAVTGLPTELRDNCSDEIRGFFTDEVIPQTDGSLILRNWTVLDFCGNASSCVQQIKVPGQNCDFPLTIEVTPPSSPTASDGVILVRVPPEAPPPPYTLVVNDEVTNNIPGRQINLPGRGVGEYTITIIIDENCQSQTVTVSLNSTGLQELGKLKVDIDLSGLQAFGGNRPLLMENELSKSVDNWLEAGTVEHPAPAMPLTYDWLAYGKNSIQLRLPTGNRQEWRLMASQFNILGEGGNSMEGKVLNLLGTGFEIALNQRFKFSSGKARPYMEGGFRTGAYLLQQGQLNGQRLLNSQLYLPFWMISFSGGLEWRPSEEFELNLKEEWLGEDVFFIGMELVYKIK